MNAPRQHLLHKLFQRNSSSYSIGVLALLVVAATIACSFGTPRQDFGGTWLSAEWGTMELQQNGNQVTGTYEYPSVAGVQYGYVEGQVDGNELTCKWWQSTTPGVGYDQAPERGIGYLVLSEDGQQISGEWRGEQQSEWAGEWTYTRQ